MLLLPQMLGRLSLLLRLVVWFPGLAKTLPVAKVPLSGQKKGEVPAFPLDQPGEKKCEVVMFRVDPRPCCSHGAVVCWQVPRRVGKFFLWPQQSSQLS